VLLGDGGVTMRQRCVTMSQGRVTSCDQRLMPSERRVAICEHFVTLREHELERRHIVRQAVELLHIHAKANLAPAQAVSDIQQLSTGIPWFWKVQRDEMLCCDADVMMRCRDAATFLSVALLSAAQPERRGYFTGR